MDADREAAINRKIELLRQKNERLRQRHQEIEADKKQAEKSGRQVNVRVAPEHHHRRSHHKQNRSYGTPHMDEPQTEVNDHGRRPVGERLDTPRGREYRGGGRGSRRGGGYHSRTRDDGLYPQEDDDNANDDERENHIQAPTLRNKTSEWNRGRDDSNRGRGLSRSQEYEQRRRANIDAMNEEMEQIKKGEMESMSRTKFLDDRSRHGQLNPNQQRSSRHRGNYGGEQFSGAHREMGNRRNHRGRGRGGRGRGNQNKMQMAAEMTGKERIDYERWSEMKEAADRERLRRSKDGKGNWRRQWDVEKLKTVPDDVNHQRNEVRKQDVNVEDFQPEEPPHEVENATPPSVEKAEEQEPLPQRQRNKTVQDIQSNDDKLVRGGTPSSKDGTEVWAQNSHNSEDSKQDWKNGINKSSKKWVNEDPGAKLIDERKLEQESAGATIYSQKLGRGWGEEKNIEATKAWVKETEDALPLEGAKASRDGRPEATIPKNSEDIIKERLNERSKYHSSSPVMKRKTNLTVKVTGRVYHNSESNVENISNDFPVMTTPEGVKHIDDWAAEVELQSPTYKKKLELNEENSEVVDDSKENKETENEEDEFEDAEDQELPSKNINEMENIKTENEDLPNETDQSMEKPQGIITENIVKEDLFTEASENVITAENMESAEK